MADDKKNLLNVLVKRRNELCALAERRRKLLGYNAQFNLHQTNTPQGSVTESEKQYIISTPTSSTAALNDPQELSVVIPHVISHAEIDKKTTTSTPQNVSVFLDDFPEYSIINNNSDIIEDSNPENNRSMEQNQRPNLTIGSSDSNDDLNTSMICLPRSHQYFKSLENLPTFKITRNSDRGCTTKTQILSNVLIKPANVIQNSSTASSSDSPKLSLKQSQTLEIQMHNSITENNAPPFCQLPTTNIYTGIEGTPKVFNQHDDINKISPTSTIDTAINEMRQMPSILTEGNVEVPLSIVSDAGSFGDTTMLQSPSILKEFDTKASSLKTSTVNFHTTARNKIITDKKTIKSKQLKRKCTKDYIDFLSDEEKLDFSSGSSDLWTDKESASNTSTSDHSKITKKKKVKKIKSVDKEVILKKKENRVNLTKLRKKLKEEGKSYETREGELVERKIMKSNPCIQGKCVRKCYDITEERRISLFNHFWRLDSQRRRDWLVRCSHLVPIKRRKIDPLTSRRTLSYEYYINDGEDHRQVCQKFLLDTLCITQKLLLYTLKYATEEMAQKDRRTSNKMLKYSEDTKQYVRSFIEKLPAVPSHYNRKNSDKKYLPTELKNISNLYRIYKKECDNDGQEMVSETIFRCIFSEYNMSFHIPKKDKCVTCTKWENEHNNPKEKDNDSHYITHKKDKEDTYKRFLAHQNIISPHNETLTCSFDLQKVLNTPHGDSMLLYYACKYAFFNFTVYESGTQDAYCYCWGESDGKRGSNEISTCLLKYLEAVDVRGVKNIVLYCDSCPGQNKNKTVLAALNHFLKSSNSLEVIQINYLLPGHSYMPVDSVHAVIEKEVRKLIVWSPSQWPTYFESARKNPRPYIVNTLEHTDFLNLDELASNTFTSKTLREIKFKEIRVATFKKKNPDEMYIKYSMEKSAVTHTVKLFDKGITTRKEGITTRKGKGRKGKERKACVTENIEQIMSLCELKPLYTERLPISKKKYESLIRLCNNGVIPKRYQQEYLSLPNFTNVPNTLPETDDEDED